MQSIYENVSKMPYGLCWVCRTLSDLIRKRELDRNIMLGYVYEGCLLSADENGLLQDTNITTRTNLMRKRRDYSAHQEDLPRDEVRSSTCF